MCMLWHRWAHTCIQPTHTVTMFLNEQPLKVNCTQIYLAHHDVTWASLWVRVLTTPLWMMVPVSTGTYSVSHVYQQRPTETKSPRDPSILRPQGYPECSCQSFRMWLCFHAQTGKQKNIWKLGHYCSLIQFILNSTVYSNIIPNSQKLEAAQPSIRRMEKQKCYPRMGKTAIYICIIKYGQQ